MKFDENVFRLRRNQPANEKNKLIFNFNDEVPKDSTSYDEIHKEIPKDCEETDVEESEQSTRDCVEVDN